MAPIQNVLFPYLKKYILQCILSPHLKIYTSSKSEDDVTIADFKKGFGVDGFKVEIC